MQGAKSTVPAISRLPLTAILLVAFGLRVALLGQRPLWYDEAFSVFLAETGVPEIIRGTAADIQPPLYYILLHFWQLLGEQVFVLRYLSVIFSILSVALVYRIALRTIGQKAALLAALFAAVAPFQVQYAQELRMYALLEFLLLVGLYALVRLEGNSSGWGMMLLMSLSGAASLYTQNLALLTLAVPVAYVIFRRNTRLARSVATSLGMDLALYVPWLAVLASQLQSIQRSYWIAPPGFAELFQFLLSSTANLPLAEWMLPIALFVTLAAIFFLVTELASHWKRIGTRGILLFLLVWIVPVLLMFIVSYTVRSVFVVRGIIVSSLAFTVLIAWWIARLKSTKAQIAIALVLIAIMLPALFYQLTYDRFPRSPYEQAVAYLHSQALPGDAIVHDNKMTYFPMHYYDRALDQTWIADPPSAGSDTLAPATMSVLGVKPTSPAQATGGKTRIWFVIYERALSEAAARGQVQANMAYMQSNFTQVGLEQFNDLYVYLYQK